MIVFDYFHFHFHFHSHFYFQVIVFDYFYFHFHFRFYFQVVVFDYLRPAGIATEWDTSYWCHRWTDLLKKKLSFKNKTIIGSYMYASGE